MCGEHVPWLKSLLTSRGSSPRVRGTLAFVPLAVFHRGIIPACAGNTAWPWLRWLMFRDHPRVCGEHFGVLCATCVGAGSSPRVRGTQLSALGNTAIRGIIPACAGNTGGSGWCSRRRWDHPRVCGNTLLSTARLRPKRDHPRVCGEHPFSSIVHNPPGGSSPRVRGTRPT